MCLVCVAVDAVVGEMGLSLSGPPHMKGKLEPLIAVLTQGGSEGRPLRKERQESRDPGSFNRAQHN